MDQMDRICGIPSFCHDQKCYDKLKKHREWEHCHSYGCHHIRTINRLNRHYHEHGIYCIICSEWFCEFHDLPTIGIIEFGDFSCVDCILNNK